MSEEKLEQIDEQLKKAQPEGPWKYGRYFSAKNIGLGLAVIVGGYLMFKQTPQGPKQMGPKLPAQYQQQIVDVPPVQKASFPMQNASYNPNAAAEAPVQRALAGQGYEPTEQRQDPMQAVKDKRKEAELAAAYASNIIVGEEKPQTASMVEVKQSAAGGTSPEAKPTQAAYTLPEGTIIEAILDSKLEGEMTGPVDAHVATDVYVPGTKEVAIPQGAKLLGEAQKVGSFSQKRLAVSFHAAQVFQEGKPFCTIQLAKDPGLDQQGGMGLTGKINNHTASLIGAGVIMSLLQAGSIGFSYGQGAGYDPTSIMIGGVANGASQTVGRIMEPRINRPAEITVPEGTRIKLRLTRDTPSSCEVSQ